MDLERDQIVGVVKYPVSHRGMAYGARPAPSGSGRKTKARAPPCSGIVRRNSILETAVVKGTPGHASGVDREDEQGMGPWPFRRRFMAVQGRCRCFVDNMETVNDTPTRRDTCGPLRAVKPNMPSARLVKVWRAPGTARARQPAPGRTLRHSGVEERAEGGSIQTALGGLRAASSRADGGRGSVSRHPGSSMRARHGCCGTGLVVGVNGAWARKGASRLLYCVCTDRAAATVALASLSPALARWLRRGRGSCC